MKITVIIAVKIKGLAAQIIVIVMQYLTLLVVYVKVKQSLGQKRQIMMPSLTPFT